MSALVGACYYWLNRVSLYPVYAVASCDYYIMERDLLDSDLSGEFDVACPGTSMDT